MLYSGNGNGFYCFAVLGGRKRGRDMIQTLRWLLFTLLLFFISSFLLLLVPTKACLIHKGLIAITAAVPWSVCLGFLLGAPSTLSFPFKIIHSLCRLPSYFVD